MFAGLLRIPDEEIDKAVARVLTHKRVEAIARRVAEMLLDQISAGLKALDQQDY